MKTSKRAAKTKYPFLPVILIIVLGFGVYANSLKGMFILDDDYLIKNNIYVKNWAHISKLFSEHIGAGSGELSNLYRPIQMLTYMIDYSLWKSDVRGYHLTNILLHVLAALTLFWLVNILYDNRLISLFTSILFLVHPIHTEAVAYISGRADSLALLFMIVSFIFYLKFYNKENLIFYMTAVLSYALALLSKETSLIFPILLILYHYSFEKRFKLKLFLPIIILFLINISLRLTVLNFPLPKITSPIPNLFQRIPSFFVAIPNYIKLLILPFNLHMEYGQRLFRLTHPMAMLGILILFTSLTYAFKIRKTHGLIFFSVFWFFISLLPVSNIWFINAYMAEHWLYLPSIGFFLILAKGLSYLYETKKLRTFTTLFAVSSLSFYSFLTVKQNTCWREPIVFYERTLKYAPDSVRMYLNLANKYIGIGRQEDAASLYRTIIKIDPNYAGAYNNLAVLSFRSGKREDAINLYKKAIELNPNYTDAYNNLAAIYCETGRKEEAINLYNKVLTLNPNYVPAYVALGVEYFSQGKQKEAIDLLRKAMEINPDYAQAYFNLSVAYFKQGQYELAIENCDKAKALGYVDPNLLEALKPHRIKKVLTK